MAQVTKTTAQIALVYPQKAETYDKIAAEAIVAGETVYVNTAGKVAKGDASAAGTLKNSGLALNSAAAGKGVSVLKRGHVAGVAVSGLNVGAVVYFSDTAGEMADAAGTTSKALGVVDANSEPTPTKLLYVDQAWNA